MTENPGCRLVAITHRFVCSSPDAFQDIAEQLAQWVRTEAGGAPTAHDLHEQTFTHYSSSPSTMDQAKAVRAAWRQNRFMTRHMPHHPATEHWGIARVDIVDAVPLTPRPADPRQPLVAAAQQLADDDRERTVGMRPPGSPGADVMAVAASPARSSAPLSPGPARGAAQSARSERTAR